MGDVHLPEGSQQEYPAAITVVTNIYYIIDTNKVGQSWVIPLFLIIMAYYCWLPSGKSTVCYGTSPRLFGNSSN